MKSSRRHGSLIPLSREHHYGLMFCLRVHRGLPLHGHDKTWVCAKAVQAVEFFEKELAPHFNAEEQVLFPAMQDFAGASMLLAELLSEHRMIERIAARLRGRRAAGLSDALLEFADLLEAHIRKEERELFPLYEKRASSGIAASVGSGIVDIIGEATRPKNPKLLE